MIEKKNLSVIYNTTSMYICLIYKYLLVKNITMEDTYSYIISIVILKETVKHQTTNKWYEN